MARVERRRTEHMESSNLPDLPPEIIYDHILTNLPVNSLLRFRSVCKPWLDQIQDKAFVKSHHERSKEKPKLLCQALPPSNQPTRRYLLQCNSRQPVAPVPLHSFPPSPSHIHSSAFGLLILQAYKPPYKIRIHNVATGLTLVLPPPADSCPLHSASHILHDPSLGAFKLLHMYYDEGNVAYEILTVGVDGSWRKPPGGREIPGVSMLPPAGLRQTAVNEAVHWTNMRLRYSPDFNEEDILAFDVKEEKFRSMAYPGSCHGGRFCRNLHAVSIGEAGGYLNLLHLDVHHTSLSVWVLKNYRKEVWIEERRLLVSFIPQSLREGSVQMLRVGEGGEEILVAVRFHEDHLLGFYNLQKGSFRDLTKEGLQSEHFTDTILLYEESLFGLGGSIFC